VGRQRVRAIWVRCTADFECLSSDPALAWQTFADLLDPPKNPHVHDPVGWVSDRLGEFLWSKQREILEAVVHHRYVAVKSAHDTGKSHGASRAVAWWLDTRDDPFATTTAPTTKQVHAILWRYMGNAHRKAGLPGRITLDAKWYVGNELVAYGRKPADYNPAAFQGIHARYVLVIIDEAGGVPKSIFDAVDALATNIDARVVAVGNPDDPASHFAIICKPGSGWQSRQSAPYLRRTPERRSPKICCHCSSPRNGWRNASSAGASPARSTNRRCSASSRTSPTTL
jgi:hypothetical protein